MEFQTLGLVDGQDADSVNLACRNGLMTKILVPESDEGLQIRGLAAQVLADSVEEAEEESILLLEPVEAQQAIEVFQQFIERCETQLLEVVVDELHVNTMFFQKESR